MNNLDLNKQISERKLLKDLEGTFITDKQFKSRSAFKTKQLQQFSTQPKFPLMDQQMKYNNIASMELSFCEPTTKLDFYAETKKKCFNFKPMKGRTLLTVGAIEDNISDTIGPRAMPIKLEQRDMSKDIKQVQNIQSFKPFAFTTVDKIGL